MEVCIRPAMTGRTTMCWHLGSPASRARCRPICEPVAGSHCEPQTTTRSRDQTVLTAIKERLGSATRMGLRGLQRPKLRGCQSDRYPSRAFVLWERLQRPRGTLVAA